MSDDQFDPDVENILDDMRHHDKPEGSSERSSTYSDRLDNQSIATSVWSATDETLPLHHHDYSLSDEIARIDRQKLGERPACIGGERYHSNQLDRKRKHDLKKRVKVMKRHLQGKEELQLTTLAQL